MPETFRTRKRRMIGRMVRYWLLVTAPGWFDVATILPAQCTCSRCIIARIIYETANRTEREKNITPVRIYGISKVRFTTRRSYKFTYIRARVKMGRKPRKIRAKKFYTDYSANVFWWIAGETRSWFRQMEIVRKLRIKTTGNFRQNPKSVVN